MQLRLFDVAKSFLLYKMTQCPKVAVLSPVYTFWSAGVAAVPTDAKLTMEDSEDLALIFGQGNKLVCCLACACERFLAYNWRTSVWHREIWTGSTIPCFPAFKLRSTNSS